MKRVLPFLYLLLLTLSFSALAEGNVFTAYTDNGVVLCNTTGRITCPAGRYDTIFELDADRGLFCVQETPSHLLRVVDEYGNAKTDTAFEDIYERNGMLYARIDGLLGVLGDDLTETIPCKYTEIMETGEGTFLAITTDPYDGKADGVYLVDESGQQSVTGTRVMFGLNSFSDGLMPAMSADTGCYGYLNTKGEWAVAAQYDYAGEFHKGCAEASLESGLGLIDTEGNWLLTPRYVSLQSNVGESTLVLAQEDTESAVLIDTATMERKKTFTGENVWIGAGFDKDVVMVQLPERSLLVDKNGETLIEAEKDAYFFTAQELGDLVIKHGGVWTEYSTKLYTAAGEARTKGYQAMDYLATYDGVRLFTVMQFETEEEEMDGETWQTQIPDSVRYGVIDEFGNEVLPMDIYFVESACDGVLLLTSDAGCKLYDLSAKEYREIG